MSEHEDLAEALDGLAERIVSELTEIRQTHGTRNAAAWASLAVGGYALTLVEKLGIDRKDAEAIASDLSERVKVRVFEQLAVRH